MSHCACLLSSCVSVFGVFCLCCYLLYDCVCAVLLNSSCCIACDVSLLFVFCGFVVFVFVVFVRLFSCFSRLDMVCVPQCCLL